MRAVKYGVTRDYVRGLEVVLPSGEVIHTGSACAKDVVGYDLTTLFVGSEGTLGVVTRATLRLLPLPEAKQTLTAAFGSMAAAARTVSDVIGRGIVPATLEFLDAPSLQAVERYAPVGVPAQAQALFADRGGRRCRLHRRAHGTCAPGLHGKRRPSDPACQGKRPNRTSCGGPGGRCLRPCAISARIR